VPSPDVTAVLDRLAERGMRRTSPRQAILEALFAWKGHVTAEELSTHVQRRFPSVNASTVYRTLEVLEEMDIVDHAHLGHGPAVYHLADREHQHLVCENCARVEDVPLAKIRPLLRMLEGEFNFSVTHRHFAIVGLCGACRST
jgi:Fur family ferric uptake transcriptional regulator